MEHYFCLLIISNHFDFIECYLTNQNILNIFQENLRYGGCVIDIFIKTRQLKRAGCEQTIVILKPAEFRSQMNLLS